MGARALAEFPEPTLIRGALLGPLVPNVQPAGIGAIAYTPDFKLTHFRASTIEGLHDWLEVAEGVGSPSNHYSGDSLYGGPLLDHFGHMLAEWMHRLWAYTHFGPGRWQRVVFQTMPGQKRPMWLDDVVRACGVDPERVLLVNDLSRFERLHVPLQGRVLGGMTTLPGYIGLFPLAPIPYDAGAPANLYVSRSRHIHTGTYLGEPLVDTILSAAGFAVVHPEHMPLAHLLTLLRSAKNIVFAEGSAIHNLELIGRVEAKVLVIGRRHGVRSRFHMLLSQLCDDLDFFGEVEPLPPLAWRDDVPNFGQACSLVPLDTLIERIAQRTGVAIRQPLSAEMDQAIAADFARYLLHPQSADGSDSDRLGRSVEALRAHPKLSRLSTRLSLSPLPGLA